MHAVDEVVAENGEAEEEESKEVEADKQSRYLGICNNMSGDLQENCATGLCGFNPK